MLRSARGSRTLPCTADATLPRGVAAVDFNVPPASTPAGEGGPGGESGEGAGAVAAELIEVGPAVTEVRLESVR